MKRGAAAAGSHSPACAACKHQRRKCAATCPLAPHFPPNRKSDFLNAHRLFGVSNILKTLDDVTDPRLRDHAVMSIIYHANARAADPVGGCFRIVTDLGRQIEQTTAELRLVRRQLSAFRAANGFSAAPGAYSRMLSNAPPLESCHAVGSESLKNEGFECWFGKQPLADVSEDIKPLLQMFDARLSDSMDALDAN